MLILLLMNSWSYDRWLSLSLAYVGIKLAYREHWTFLYCRIQCIYSNKVTIDTRNSANQGCSPYIVQYVSICRRFSLLFNVNFIHTKCRITLKNKKIVSTSVYFYCRSLIQHRSGKKTIDSLICQAKEEITSLPHNLISTYIARKGLFIHLARMNFAITICYLELVFSIYSMKRNI